MRACVICMLQAHHFLSVAPELLQQPRVIASGKAAAYRAALLEPHDQLEDALISEVSELLLA